MDPIAPILLLLLVFLAIVLAIATGRKQRYTTTMKPLLSEAELKIFADLQDAFGQTYHVFPKVSAAAIFESTSNGSHVEIQDSSRALQGRSVDFLICDKATGAVSAAVLLSEHADGTGDRFFTAARSAFFAADIPVYEMDLARGFSTTEIATQLRLSTRPVGA